MRAFSLDLHLVGGDRYFLFHVAYAESDIDSHLVVDLEDDVGSIKLLEAGKRGVDRIGSHGQSEKTIRTIVSGDRLLREVGLDIRDPNVDAFHNGLGRIVDHAKNGAGDICEQHTGKSEDQEDNENRDDVFVTHAHHSAPRVAVSFDRVFKPPVFMKPN